MNLCALLQLLLEIEANLVFGPEPAGLSKGAEGRGRLRWEGWTWPGPPPSPQSPLPPSLPHPLRIL